MAKLSITLEVENREILNEDVCDGCRFSCFICKGGKKCSIFNKVLEEFSPLSKVPSVKSYKRLQECKDSEIKL